MRIRTRVRALPKLGNRPDEYEDAYWPPAGEREVGAFRCAVADGATEASFSGMWASMLTRAYCKGRLTGRHQQASLLHLGRQWSAAVGGKPLPWYAEEKLREGAFSSLLGVSLGTCGAHLCWNALAAGDSCLVHVRDGEVVGSFPLQHWTEFDSRPALLSSNPQYTAGGKATMQVASGRLARGDTLLLMTDALAAWYLRCEDEGGHPWCRLAAVLDDEDAFRGWIGMLREGKHIRNDDVTVLAVDMPD